MKKVLMGVFAVIFALGLSAFNLPHQPKASTSLGTLNYWEYNPNTGVLGDFLGSFNPDTQQAELEDASCLDNGDIECARGYISSMKPDTPNEIEDFQDNVAHD